MDYETYRKSYFTDPAPEPRFAMSHLAGVSLSFAKYDKAIAFYTEVLGPPAYIEGEGTTGWRIGSTWLTLFQSEAGDPANAEFQVMLESPEEADRMHAALLGAGAASGCAPGDVLCYEPLRFGYVTDPWGTVISVSARRTEAGGSTS